MSFLDALDNMLSTCGCTIINDSFNTDTSANYTFTGGNPTVGSGLMSVPSGCEVRYSACYNKLQSVRIAIDADIDNTDTLSVFFWGQDTGAFSVRVKSNTGLSPTDSGYDACLVQLYRGNALVRSRNHSGTLMPLIVEAWLNQAGDDAMVTVNSEWTWNVSRLTTPAPANGTYGFASISGAFDVLSYQVDLVSNTWDEINPKTLGEGLQCRECEPSETINACDHREDCNGGTMDEDFYTGPGSYPPNVSSGWYVSSDSWTTNGTTFVADDPSTLWEVVDSLTVTFHRPATGNCAGVGEPIKRWVNTGKAIRHVRVTECASSVVVTIELQKKHAYGNLTARMSIIPVCGSSNYYTASETFTGTSGDVPCDGDQCLATETDIVTNTYNNVPVGIYRIECDVAKVSFTDDPGQSNNCVEEGDPIGIAGYSEVQVEFSISGVETYLIECP